MSFDKDMLKQIKKSIVTPIGKVFITDGESSIPFTVDKNDCDYMLDIYDENNKPTGRKIHTETNYQIAIKTNDLEIGKIYKIVFSGGKLEFSDSDEGTEGLSITKDGWTFGIGMFNPNEYEEMEQSIRHSINIGKGIYGNQIPRFEYDESRFRNYIIESSDDKSGYTFRLLDRDRDEIIFKIAWIEHKDIDPLRCDDAISFWIVM